MRTLRVLLPALLAAACASSDDPLVWSDEVARVLPRQEGAVIEAARFSRLQPGAPSLGGWEPFLVVQGNTPTDYRLVESAGTVVLSAESREGGSGLWRKMRIDPRRHPVMEWRWRVPRDSGRGGPRGPSRASPPVRISVGFHGDTSKLDFDARTKLRLARALTVNGLPYATLIYVWRNGEKAETVYPSPYTERVRHVVVESGERRLDQWVSVRRNVLEDYRRAFGEEPDDIVGVGLMVDYGDDGNPRRAFYGDITFRSP